MDKPIIKLITLITLGFMLTACNTMQRMHQSELMNDFDTTFVQYSKFLRWGHFRELTTFMTKDHVAPSMAKIDSLKNIRISKVNPIAWILDEEKGVMVGDVVIDYYVTNKAVIRQTTQQQVWRWIDEHWKLDTGLPDLRG
jgi:hypothetical protein